MKLALKIANVSVIKWAETLIFQMIKFNQQVININGFVKAVNKRWLNQRFNVTISWIINSNYDFN